MESSLQLAIEFRIAAICLCFAGSGRPLQRGRHEEGRAAAPRAPVHALHARVGARRFGRASWCGQGTCGAI